MTEVKKAEAVSVPQKLVVGRFSDLVNYNLGRTPPRADKRYWKEGVYPWVSISDMSEYGVITDTAEKVSELANQEIFRNRLVPKGTLLMSFKLTIGRTSLLAIDAYHNEAIISIYPDEKKILAKYLFYYLPTINYAHYQDTAIKGKTLNKSKINKLEIPLLPLSEQANIIYILSKVQSAIETQEHIINTTNELKKAMMQKLFTEGLNGEQQKETEIGLVPKSWGVGEIMNVVCDTEIRNPLKEPTKTIKYIDVSSVSNKTFSVVSYQDYLGKDAPGRARKVVHTNDIIFATIRPTLKRVAKITKEYDDEYCSTAFCVLRVNTDKFDYEFLYQYLLTDSFIKEIARLQSGASYPAVRDDNIKEMKIPYPTIKEQKEIGLILKQLDSKIEIATKKMATLQSLFKSMLHHLMTGQIRVSDLKLA